MKDIVSKKKLVDKFIRELACERRNRFAASFISKIDVDIDFVKERLLQLSKDDQLTINFEVICPGCEHKTIYSDFNDVPIGESINCANCRNEFLVTKENVWITFSPNKNYYDDEMCNIICK